MFAKYAELGSLTKTHAYLVANTRHQVRQGVRGYQSLGGMAKLRERVLALRGDGLTADEIAATLKREGHPASFAGSRESLITHLG